MRFELVSCPECGGRPGAIEEVMVVDQGIALDETGGFQYTGEYRDHDETLEPATDGQGRVTLVCTNDDAHQWQTHLTAES